MVLAKVLSSLGLVFDIAGVIVLFWEGYRITRLPGDQRPAWGAEGEAHKREVLITRLGFGSLMIGFGLQLLGIIVSS